MGRQGPVEWAGPSYYVCFAHVVFSRFLEVDFFFGANFPENRNFHEENMTARAGFVGPDPQFWGVSKSKKIENFRFFQNVSKVSLKCMGVQKT